ncbi:hypothetical protein AAKU58_004455, partial [Oxalobacteraceae bacterium GrIS 1.18]
CALGRNRSRGKSFLPPLFVDLTTETASYSEK